METHSDNTLTHSDNTFTHSDNTHNGEMDVGGSEIAKEMDTDNSNINISVHKDGDFESDPIASESTDNADVVMDDGDNANAGKEADQEPDESDADSDNEDEEEEAEEEEEDTGEYTEQAKSGAGHRGQVVSDSVFSAFSFTGDVVKNVENAECVKSLHQESERWVSQDSINTAVVNTQKQFVCVKFPAIIKNKDKAVTCLGGARNIMQARKMGKIELVFRPDDPYSKPAVGSYKKNNHLLVKCRRRRKVKGVDQPSTSARSEEDEMDDGYEYKVEVIGTVLGSYSFDRPCDFQYLPVTKKPGGDGYREILSDLVVKFQDERTEFMNRDVPLFLPPYIFSRSERPAKYIFQNDEKTEQKHIGMARKMRHMGTYRVTFASKDLPTKPHASAVSIYKSNEVSLEPLKKLFEERPMWSKVAISSRLQAIDQLPLKKHLAMLAYLFYTGPWIHMWCRLGYDPRKHVEAKMFQTIDFRIRNSLLREKVNAKRKNNFSMSRPGVNTVHGHRLPSNMGQMTTPDGPSTSTASDTQPFDVQYQFVQDKMPPYRQMYYQVCDVMHDEVQELAHQNDGKETVCTEKDGWCIPDFSALSRDILMKHSEKLLWSKSFGEDGKEVDMT